MDHTQQAAELFLAGYNCAQAVAMAFADITKLDPVTVAKHISPFGGGMGRLREVCGAVSGMLTVYGQLYGYDHPDDTAKKHCYATVQELAERFRQQAGSIVCREILNNPPTDPAPSPRTEEYYKQRPCVRMVMIAAQILDEYITENPV